MAPIKLEETIKNKLEKRTLEPSNDAWAQLAKQLDAEDKKKSRSLFFYVAIAASIVGVLFVTTLFFKSSEEQTVMPTVVETIDQSQEQQDHVSNSNPLESVVAVSSSDSVQKETTTNEIVPQEHPSMVNEQNVATISEEKTIDKASSNNIIETKTAIVAVKTSIEKQNNVTLLNELTFEEAKAIEVVAQIKNIEIEKGSVTDAEIEALLKQAEKEILKQRIYNETTRTVDANALLQDVEDDLDRSFRTRVFETLKSSYKTVKTAVAERNN
jgi:hypothetical protein